METGKAAEVPSHGCSALSNGPDTTPPPLSDSPRPSPSSSRSASPHGSPQSEPATPQSSPEKSGQTTIQPEPEPSLTNLDPNSSGTMAPRNRPVAVRRDADFSGLLTAGQKNELTMLIGAITDTMREHITRTFDEATMVPFKIGGRAKARAWRMKPSSVDLKNLRVDHKETSTQLKENRRCRDMEADIQAIMSSLSSNEDSATVDAEALGPSLENLKKDALATYRRWQAQIAKRVNEITVAKDSTAQKTSTATAASSPVAKTQQKPVGNSKALGKSSKPAPVAMSGKGPLKHEDAQDQFQMTEGDAVLVQLYGPVPTSLSSLPVEKRRLLLHSVMLLLLSLESYAACSRVLLLHMASSLRIPPHELADDEVRVAVGLSWLAKENCVEDPLQKRSDENGSKNLRRWKAGGFGSITAPGSAGGGLAAPLEVAGVGSVMDGTIGHGPVATASLLGPMADNSYTVGALFGIYGARGAGKIMESYLRDIPTFAFLPLYGPPHAQFEGAREVEADHRRLRVVVGVNGWMTNDSDLTGPWRALGGQSETYSLRWNTEYLGKVACALETVARSAAWSSAKQEIAANASRCHDYTPLNILRGEAAITSPQMTLWPHSLLKISKIVDIPWSGGLVEADKAGVVLAEAIMNRIQGERAVSLVGFSLGARVIYMCLMILAEKRALGLVENVALMGAPVPADARVWSAMRSAVAGRLVNVYSERDYLLAFLSREGSVQFGVAGLQCIEGQPGVENVNASALVKEHLRYQYLEGTILKNLGWEGIEEAQVAKDERALRTFEERIEENKGVGRGAVVVAAEEVPGSDGRWKSHDKTGKKLDGIADWPNTKRTGQ